MKNTSVDAALRYLTKRNALPPYGRHSSAIRPAYAVCPRRINNPTLTQSNNDTLFQ
jgi:hypothetical protein